MTALLVSIAIIAVMLLVYMLIIRPWHLHWGATKQEVLTSMPGDGLVRHPDFNATRAITIRASPEIIWRWMIQIGSRRAGWYSIDWIDNAGIRSTNEILPRFQNIHKGQFIPFTPDQKNGMWVKDFRHNAFILWEDKAGNASWLWQLNPQEDGTTRLITRLRTKYVWKGLWVIYYILYDIGDIIMMRKCLKGIRSRAEHEYLTIKKEM